MYLRIQIWRSDRLSVPPGGVWLQLVNCNDNKLRSGLQTIDFGLTFILWLWCEKQLTMCVKKLSAVVLHHDSKHKCESKAVIVRAAYLSIDLQQVNIISTRVPYSKAREQDSPTFIQPCMWYLHDGAGQTLCCLTHGELAWLFLEPYTGLEIAL